MRRSARYSWLAVPALATLALVSGLIGFSPVAQAGDGYGPDRYGAVGDGGWSGDEAVCRMVMDDEGRCPLGDRETQVEREGVAVAEGRAVRLPDSFFADEGGVGPAFVDYGGSSGGFVLVSGGAFAGASASASARVSVSIGIRGGFHGGGFMHGGHGCGCGGRW